MLPQSDSGAQGECLFDGLAQSELFELGKCP
jgi:hypothetical protein